MTLKSLNKKFAVASVALLSLAAAGSVAVGMASFADRPVYAAVQTPNPATPQIVIHANSAAPTMSGGTQTNAAGTTNDGTDQSSLDGISPMANVKFTATEITPTAGETAADMTTDSSTYVPGTVYNGVTGSDGTAVISVDAASSPSNVTYYLVHQVTTVGGITSMADFITSVPLNNNLNVTVYPKQDMEASAGADQTVANGSDATTTDNTGTLKQTTVFAGQQVVLTDKTVFSPSQVSTDTDNTQTPGSYVITDTLPSGETYDNTTGVTVTAPDGTTVPAADYTVDSTTTPGTVTISLNADGQKFVESHLVNGAAGQLTTTIGATVDSSYSNGILQNSFTTAVTNAYGVDLSATAAAQTTLPGDTAAVTTGNGSGATVYVGALKVEKETTSGTAIPNAVFAIATSEANATAHTFLASDGNSYAATVNSDGSLTATGTLPAGVSFVTEKSGTDGIATFNGLGLSDVAADKGNDASDTTTGTDYYVVETAAPAGYLLSNTPVKATAYITPQTTTFKDSQVTLPFTGRIGLATVVVIAAVGGTTAFVLRRRKAEDEEAVK